MLNDSIALAQHIERLTQLHYKRKFHAKQQEVIDAIFKHGYKRIFVKKGRKGGGTETVLYPLVRIAGLFPGSANYIIGPNHKLQKEIVWSNQRLQRYFPEEWKAYPKESETRMIVPFGEGRRDSFVKVDGADNWKTMAGWEPDVLVFDELRDQDPRAYREAYPNLAARDGILIVVGVPPNSKNNFYYELEQAAIADPAWKIIHWPIWDNAEFLPGGKEGIEKEKKAYYDRGDWDLWQNLYEAKYVFGGRHTVLSRFRRDLHVVPHEIIMERIRGDKGKLLWGISCDPGYATCFAIAFIAYNPYSGEIFILDEVYETNRSKLNVGYLWPLVEQKKKDLYPEGKWSHLYDSAAAGFPNEVRSRFGNNIHFKPTVKDKDDEDKYFRIWNGLFDEDEAQNRCLVSERCVNGINEMESYVTDDNGRYPVGNEHFCDCVRYKLKALGYKPREKQDNLVIVKPSFGVTYAMAQEQERKKTDWTESILNMETSLDDWN